MSTNVFAKFRCTVLRIKKALGIFTELITTTTTTTTTTKTKTTRVAFWDPLPRPRSNDMLECVIPS